MTTSHTLYVVEVIHWVALGVMMAVYIIRLFWMFSFRGVRDRQLPGERGDTSLYPRLYSLANVAMPWGMESTRNHFTFYLTFVIFHVAVAVGIFLAVVNGLYPPLMETPVVGYLFMAIMGAAFLVGAGRVVRRIVSPVMRLISTPDDYFCVFLLTVGFLSGVLAQAYLIDLLEGQGYLIWYLLLTSFFLVYVPFSKISHYLYYPFTRYWIGKTLGHRGSMPAIRDSRRTS